MKTPVWIGLCLLMAVDVFAGAIDLSKGDKLFQTTDIFPSLEACPDSHASGGCRGGSNLQPTCFLNQQSKSTSNNKFVTLSPIAIELLKGDKFLTGNHKSDKRNKSLRDLFPSLEGCRGGSNLATDTTNYKKRQNLCYAVGFGGTALVHAGLYQLWYKDYPSSKFHFFNDNHEWLQMDKCGHAFSSYYLGLVGIEAAKWAGVPAHKQWRWALFGSIFQDPIEIWDGFSSGWGASSGDLIANTFGTVLSAGQHALWREQKFTLKFSYSPSSYTSSRPNVLGSNFQEQLLKDYNGQTYWLCYSPVKAKNWEWLGLAFGYGAEGMVGGENNTWTDKDHVFHDYSHIQRYRQYYLALDYNLTKIRTRNPTLKTLFFILNCIKLPSPAIEFSNKKLKGHWLKF
jgi:hypothetical protein